VEKNFIAAQIARAPHLFQGKALCNGRVIPHGEGSGRAVTLDDNGKHIAVKKNERQIMHLLFSPVFASALYIGGGSVGLLLVIVIVVLLLR
jgi:hypothetical protein